MSKDRELLKRFLAVWDADVDCADQGEVYLALDSTVEEIRSFLATEPEAESVCWICSKIDEHEEYKIEWTKDDLTYWIRRGWDVEPLYTRSEPARKPMTEEEIENVFFSRMGFVSGYLEAFTKGFRSAEKYHGIGEIVNERTEEDLG